MTEKCDTYAGWFGINHKWAHCRDGEEACLTIELLSVTSEYAYVGVDRSWADKEGRAINKGEHIEYLEGDTTWRVYCDGVSTSQDLASIRICHTKETTPSLKNIPPEVVDIMPTGTTRIVAIPLKPLSWANFNGLRSHLSPIVDIVARTITVGGYIGWRSLGVDVVKLSTGEILMVVFLGGV